MSSITKEQVERTARMYKSNEDASRALGITMRSYSRLCRKFDIESPFARKKRLKEQTQKEQMELGADANGQYIEVS